MLAFDYCVARRGRFKGYLDGLEASLDRRDPAPVVVGDDQAARMGAVACHLLARVFLMLPVIHESVSLGNRSLYLLR